MLLETLFEYLSYKYNKEAARFIISKTISLHYF